jgi:hypothetical protein
LHHRIAKNRKSLLKPAANSKEYAAFFVSGPLCTTGGVR